MPVALLIPLLAVVSALLVLSLASTWEITFGPLLRGIAAAVANLPITSAGRRLLHLSALAAAIVAFEQALHRRIGEAVGHMAAPLASVLYAVGRAFVYPSAQVAGLADDVGTALWHLRRDLIPAMIAAKTGWIVAHLQRLEAEAGHVAHDITRVVVHDAPRVVKSTVTTVVEKAVALPWPRLGRVEREAGALGKRLDSLARRVAPAALVAATVATLARVGAGWIRCSKVKKIGKQVCGMDESLLESLIADTLLVVGAISIVEFAEALQAVESEVVAGLRGFVREI